MSTVFIAIVFAVAVLGGALAAVAGAGIGSTLVPLLALRIDLKHEDGISFDWLGKLVDRVSGESLEVYYRGRRPVGVLRGSGHDWRRDRRISPCALRHSGGRLGDSPE
jgi:hypothetical protein